jgi:hypothetical protein
VRHAAGPWPDVAAAPTLWQPSLRGAGWSSETCAADPCGHSLLPPNTDLKAALAAERQRLLDEGWTADELTRYAFVFCRRENERVCVSIEHFEPGTAALGHGSMIGRKR